MIFGGTVLRHPEVKCISQFRIAGTPLQARGTISALGLRAPVGHRVPRETQPRLFQKDSHRQLHHTHQGQVHRRQQAGISTKKSSKHIQQFGLRPLILLLLLEQVPCCQGSTILVETITIFFPMECPSLAAVHRILTN